MYIKYVLFLFSALLLLSGCTKEVAPNVSATKTQEQKSYLEPDERCSKDKEWSEENIAKWLDESLERIKLVKIARSLDNNALCQLSSKKIARSFYRLDNPKRPDQPDHALIFRAKQQSVYGVVKPDGLMNAMEQRKQSIANTQLLSVANIEGAAYIDKASWIDLGPGNIGGRTRAVYIHPTDTNIIFIGSVGGGIWKSADGGASWAAVDDFMANISITSIVADPTTTANVATTVLYASTGEGFINVDSLRGYGVFKSTDGGTTWNHLASTDPTLDGDWYYTNRLAVNSIGNIIAVTRDNGIFVSTDAGTSWSKSVPGGYMVDVKYDPNDDTKAIAGSVNGNCYYTTDSGATWTLKNIVSAAGWFFDGRVEIAYAANTIDTVYASVDKNSGEIYRSTDGGVSWSLLSTPAHLGGQGWYDNTIWVDPTNANHLVIGGLDLWRSTDGGANWTKISTWYYSPSSPHADHHMIIHDPSYNGTTNKRVYIANDGGLYKADDISAADSSASSNGWTNLNNDLAITQFYGAAGILGSNIIGGTQDNGALMQSAGTTWVDRFGGDGGFSAVSNNPNNPGTYYYFGEYVYLQIHRSDNGAWANYIDSGISDAGANANFIAPFMLDPNNDNTMYAGGDSLWRSTNVNDSTIGNIVWSNIKSSTGSNISQITVAEGNSDIVMVGHNNGEIYISTDATNVTPTWTQIYTSNGKYVLSLLVDKDNNNILYAGWGGFVSDNLKKSIDGGTVWTTISGDLPDAPMRSIVRHPTIQDYLYVGTEVGVFTSENQGTNWFTDNDGPANVSVDKLFWYDDTTLVAGTHGRGMFKITVVAPPVQNNASLPAIIMYLLN